MFLLHKNAPHYGILGLSKIVLNSAISSNKKKSSWIYIDGVWGLFTVHRVA